jgi:hypothetical protein
MPGNITVVRVGRANKQLKAWTRENRGFSTDGILIRQGTRVDAGKMKHRREQHLYVFTWQGRQQKITGRDKVTRAAISFQRPIVPGRSSFHVVSLIRRNLRQGGD